MSNSSRMWQVAYVLIAALLLAIIAWMAAVGEYGVCALIIIAACAYAAYRRLHR